MKIAKEKNGITLIALIITIVVMLILSVVTTNLTLGENGLLARAGAASKKATEVDNDEKEKIAGYVEAIDKWGDITSNRDGKLPESLIISGATITVEQPATDFIIDLKIDSSSTINNLLGILFVDNKLYKGFSFDEINNKQIKVTDVKINTKYNIYMILVDEDGGFVETNKVDITTKDSIYEWKKMDYPLLTKTGMKNMMFIDQYGNIADYKKDLTQGNCTASDALAIEAWDGNSSTYVRTGTYYIKVAEEMLGEKLTWRQSATNNCTSRWTLCNENRTPISGESSFNNYYWWSDTGPGNRTIQPETKYIKYYSNGHLLYEIPNP